MSSTRIRKGMGKIEFLANRPRIQELKTKGYSAKMVYGELRKKGLITQSYLQFWKYWAKMPTVSLPLSSPLASPSSVPALPVSTEHAPFEANSPALPPAKAEALPEKRGRKHGKNSSAQKDGVPAVIQAPEDFIPTPFPID